MPGHESMELQNDYSERDLQMLFQQTNADGWAPAIGWLRSDGHQQLAPGHAERMLLDLEKLQHEDTHFVRDPHQLYEMAKQHRMR
jgi:hypothetical protein